MAVDNKPNPSAKPSQKPPAPVAGDGIRSLETSGVFRTLNFELYTKPNRLVMGFGIVAITGCVAYLAWMKNQHKEKV